jgi:NADH dehydrogenase
MPDRIDRLITIFGAGGFVGRYVAQNLLKAGVRLRGAERDPKGAWFLKPLGTPGQIQLMSADIRSPETVARAVAGADVVINLVGILKGDLESFHVHGAANVARAAAEAGCSGLVHISAIGADPDSPSDYGRSKGRGELAVREAFPNATIIRPSIVFGPEDNFISRFAAMGRQLPVLPVMAPNAKFQPVYVADLGRAIAAAALEPRKHAGQVYELGGPHVFTMAELNASISRLTGREGKPVAVIPDAVGGLMAKLTGWLPGAPITMDQWRMLQVPNVVSEGATGFEAFGIRPQPFEAVAGNWLTPFRKGGRFADKSSPY